MLISNDIFFEFHVLKSHRPRLHSNPPRTQPPAKMSTFDSSEAYQAKQEVFVRKPRPLQHNLLPQKFPKLTTSSSMTAAKSPSSTPSTALPPSPPSATTPPPSSPSSTPTPAPRNTS